MAICPRCGSSIEPCKSHQAAAVVADCLGPSWLPAAIVGALFGSVVLGRLFLWLVW